MECVVSRTMTTLNGLVDAPLMAAVAVEVRLAELKPKYRRRKSGTDACCFTTTAFEPEGP